MVEARAKDLTSGAGVTRCLKIEADKEFLYADKISSRFEVQQNCILYVLLGVNKFFSQSLL